MTVKEEREHVGLKLNIQKTKIGASGPIQGTTGDHGEPGAVVLGVVACESLWLHHAPV